jgi:uncharacterized protein YbjT (DUF2867 family)
VTQVTPRPGLRPGGAPAATQWITGDLVSGDGLADAVAGVAAVVHCASDPRRPRVDVEGTRQLLEAAPGRGDPAPGRRLDHRGGPRPPPLLPGKLAAERLIQASELGWTILRATQFHQLVLLAAQGLARLPLVPVPAATSFQPIDAGEVVDPLAELAVGPPAGRVPDLGGPQIRTATDLLRAYLQAAGRRRLVLPVWLPGAVLAGCRQGVLRRWPGVRRGGRRPAAGARSGHRDGRDGGRRGRAVLPRCTTTAPGRCGGWGAASG